MIGKILLFVLGIVAGRLWWGDGTRPEDYFGSPRRRTLVGPAGD